MATSKSMLLLLFVVLSFSLTKQQHCDLCSLQAEIGPCEAAIPKWYFDLNQHKCLQFTYGGCQGNENRFETLEECTKHCPGDKPEP
ncbi:hemolymph trypsin inhibitor B [Biomphalaria glabrata]|nr:hemolymph trypsin inhibitor B [Biomphalaria glabrata]